MGNTMSFEIPNTPENKKAFEELKKKFDGDPCTLYGVNKKGEAFPVMNITKHPDCPEGWYEDMMRRFLNFKEGKKDE